MLFFDSPQSKSFTRYQKILWERSFGCKNLLNSTCLTMKFHSCHHASDDSLSSLVKDDRSLFEEQHNVCNFSAENDSHGVSPHLHIDCTSPLKHRSISSFSYLISPPHIHSIIYEMAYVMCAYMLSYKVLEF